MGSYKWAYWVPLRVPLRVPFKGSFKGLGVVISGLISPAIRVISKVSLLIISLISTQEPPSR